MFLQYILILWDPLRLSKYDTNLDNYLVCNFFIIKNIFQHQLHCLFLSMHFTNTIRSECGFFFNKILNSAHVLHIFKVLTTWPSAPLLVFTEISLYKCWRLCKQIFLFIVLLEIVLIFKLSCDKLFCWRPVPPI